MKKLLFILLILFASCNLGQEKKARQQKAQTYSEVTATSLVHFLSLLDDEEKLNLELMRHGFLKKMSGVYTSASLVSYNEPKHWIHTSNIPGFEFIIFSTVEVKRLDDLTDEIGGIKVLVKKSETEFTYHHKGYTYEVYRPKNGLNLALNELFSFSVKKSD